MTSEQAAFVEDCKQRALRLLIDGKPAHAVAVILSDLSDYNTETRALITTKKPAAFMFVLNDDRNGLRDWINSF